MLNGNGISHLPTQFYRKKFKAVKQDTHLIREPVLNFHHTFVLIDLKLLGFENPTKDNKFFNK